MFRYLVALFLFVTLPALGAMPYKLAPTPQPVSGPKVEVIEFFWYGCNHCYDLDPKLSAWAKTRSDIEFKRVHVPLGAGWVSMTKAYYTLAQMKQINNLHTKIFDAMHKQNIPLDDPKFLFDWVGKQGIDVDKFKSIYDSFGVQVNVKQAEKLATTYRLTGVPAIVIDGKYITSPGMVGDHDLNKVLNDLVEKAKAERKQAGK